jgi:hypothetical protein
VATLPLGEPVTDVEMAPFVVIEKEVPLLLLMCVELSNMLTVAHVPVHEAPTPDVDLESAVSVIPGRIEKIMAAGTASVVPIFKLVIRNVVEAPKTAIVSLDVEVV